MPVSKEEKFHILGATFNVWKAYQIVKGRPTVTAEPSWSYFNLVRVDKEYALKSTDLAEPVIVVQLPFDEGKLSPLLIDGAHRNYRALKEAKTLEAWVLTPEESVSVMEDCPTLKRKFKKNLLTTGPYIHYLSTPQRRPHESTSKTLQSKTET